MPAIFSPCWRLVGLINAPVGINNILFKFLLLSWWNIFPQNVTAEQAQPLPPEWVS